MFAVEVPSLLLQRTKLGAHQWDITIGELITQVYYFHIADSFYCIGTLFLKTGITVQCLRLFCLEKTSRLATYLLRTLLWINILLYLVSAGVIGFPCSPVRKTWDVTVEGHCINEFVTAFVMAIINTISDLLLVIIPLRALWTLSWDMKRKLRVSTLFAIGLGACICAITRLAPSWSLYRSDDKTYYLELNGALGVLEYFFGLCAACFPVLPKFLKYVVDHSPLVGFRNGTSKLPDVEENKCEEQARGEKPQIVSDVEFHELVNGGDTLGSESGTKVRHDSGGTRREVGVAHKDKGPAVQEHAP
ncbi:hypothetical protein K491DRAFT_693251 [Lophiostoma macrostomum CBS 122681]|uniref:Rhodopsin domain-containing protein n=1 Tax=Lophiostoma macrostomum CBS 122681 TaxID=1314788 RepID=A0A6A6T607_9PLEO|nr:hypothetical protein K491DRAFT_693251 [Lophiostoma macrostomum CBS 122681]